jgi:hypothetical protein
VFALFVSDACEISGIMNIVEAMWTLYSCHRGASAALEQKSVARLLERVDDKSIPFVRLIDALLGYTRCCSTKNESDFSLVTG